MPEQKKDAESASIDGKSELTRREVIKLGAGAAIAATIIGLDSTALAQSAPDKAPLFFTKQEFAVVDEITELIIPADDHSPGARTAQVAGYSDCQSPLTNSQRLYGARA
ncbi:MAG: hypothetical protein DMF60_04705 [Acidobacteria bacterium]|nr:MAG: hypothetical protein DMF60_04705 [Acidobacteriota bacterium]